MTTLATQIRDAIFTRVNTIPGYTSKRKTPVPQIQPEDLPTLCVYIMGESLTPDGEANVGEPRFETETTIAVSVIRGFNTNDLLQDDIDADLDAIETALLSDPTFVAFGPNGLSEAVARISRRRLFPQQGETYFAELRLEMTFLTRVSYPPIITDDFETLFLTVKQLGASADTDPVLAQFEIPTS